MPIGIPFFSSEVQSSIVLVARNGEISCYLSNLVAHCVEQFNLSYAIWTIQHKTSNSPKNSDKDIDYEISSIDGSQIGNLSKQWSGLLQESFTDADNFGVSFPIDLDVKCKLSLLAAVFLIVSIPHFKPKCKNFSGLYVLRAKTRQA